VSTKSELTEEALQSCLFEGLSEAETEHVLSKAQIKSFSDGEYLVHRGDATFEFHLILEGKLKVCNDMGDLLNVLEVGTVLGEVAFIDRTRRSASAIADGPAVVAVFPGTLAEDLSGRPEVLAKVMLNLARSMCRKLRGATRLAETSFV
jgi:CRP-like cAMP-binding protein